ncbi:hypothetical protein [Lacticaseibacillus jixiensis]|uniref:hypothetical protein n=1 Tax=Lacticaseibacillus jixiensis TaxID=3231926 RepID=UPI0036F2EDB1
MRQSDTDYQEKKVFLGRWLPIRSRMNDTEMRLRELNIDDGVHSVVPSAAHVMMTLREYESRYEKAERLQERLDNLVSRGKVVRKEIYEALDSLDNPVEAAVLERYYIDGRTQYAISIDMDYSLRWIERVFMNGLAHITLPD